MRKIKVICENQEYRKHITDILYIFYLNKDINVLTTTIVNEDELKLSADSDLLITNFSNGCVNMKYTVSEGTFYTVIDDISITKDRTKTIKKKIFSFINGIRKENLPWGFLTGVRPVKMVVNMLIQGNTPDFALEVLINDFLVDPMKARLIVYLAEKDLHLFGYDNVINDSVSVYISIPFCPDRCTYCSFSSYPYDKFGHMADKYIDCLIVELNKIKIGLIKENKYIRSIYIGGGTPAVLSTPLIDKLLNTVDSLCSDKSTEVTFEAGRPEVFDDLKQKTVKKHNVTRICINPQSLDDNILKAIGRNHTVNDFYTCYNNAVKNGFGNINTDIIAGLPGETTHNYIKNLNELLMLGQQSITVHTLAMKRKSILIDNNNAQKIVNNKDIDEMLEITESEFINKGFLPYYLYRQKMSVGNRENIGYCKEGYECIYNMQMIGERHTVIGAGAGATGRFVLSDATVTRNCNKKLIDQYIADIENNKIQAGEINE